MSRYTASERAARAHWARRQRRLMAEGKWQPLVDAEPVRAHVRAVQAAGMPVCALAVKVGLQPDALKHLMRGDTRHGPGERVRRETAELVMSYWPRLEDYPDAALIDATGTRRRVQALAVWGWPQKWVASEVGMWDKAFSRAMSMDRVTAKLARSVVEVYDRWWNQAPERHGVPGWVADRARRAAERKRWASPLAWDDDTIDDPHAVAQTDAPAALPDSSPDAVDRWLHGEAVVLDVEGRRRALAHLMEFTSLSAEEIGARLEMSPASVDRAWERIKARARKGGGPVPYRRMSPAAVGRLTTAA